MIILKYPVICHLDSLFDLTSNYVAQLGNTIEDDYDYATDA
jgi:hypothetical protein